MTSISSSATSGAGGSPPPQPSESGDEELAAAWDLWFDLAQGLLAVAAAGRSAAGRVGRRLRVGDGGDRQGVVGLEQEEKDVDQLVRHLGRRRIAAAAAIGV